MVAMTEVLFAIGGVVACLIQLALQVRIPYTWLLSPTICVYGIPYTSLSSRTICVSVCICDRVHWWHASYSWRCKFELQVFEVFTNRVQIGTLLHYCMLHNVPTLSSTRSVP